MLRKIFVYSHMKVAIITGIVALGFIYATIYVSTFPDKQGMGWQIAFGMTAVILAVITTALVIIHFNEIDRKRRGY